MGIFNRHAEPGDVTCHAKIDYPGGLSTILPEYELPEGIGVPTRHYVHSYAKQVERMAAASGATGYTVRGVGDDNIERGPDYYQVQGSYDDDGVWTINYGID